MHSGSFSPSFIFYFGWAFGVFSIPVYVINGIGLLRAREWARRIAVGFAIVTAIYGLWGISRTITALEGTKDFSFMLRSPMFLVSIVWSLALLVFDIGTAVLLSLPSVRAAFSRKSPAAV